METHDFALLGLFFAALLVATPLLGKLLARVLDGNIPYGLRWLRPLEKALYRLSGINAETEMSWRAYALGLLVFNLLGGALILVLQLAQAALPLNPQNFPAVPLGVAVNTAVSFITNTNWQAYSGEASLSYLTQMAGLGVQNFLSAATGLAVLAALARGFARRQSATFGNFWTDLTRSTLYVLLPLSVVFAIVLVAQGVVMNFTP
ncbi:MAG: potassium-transporting ATPase subunit KdpA [Verrucomicrobia bacterium]|nr:potassium-transporting ATPase subunit KdpA [Verrucomicrobiota bacterium]